MTIHHRGFQLSWTPSSGDTQSRDDAEAIAKVLLDAFDKYLERNRERSSIWRRSGLRGQTENLFAKGERAFAQAMRGEVPNVDNYIDAIVYSAFALVLMREADGNGPVPSELQTRELLNGEWPWDG